MDEIRPAMSPSASPDPGEEASAGRPAAAPRRATFRETFRAKLPELVLEAASVVLAVLLALAVDEWREGRQLRELTGRATLRVEQEVRDNLDELAGSRASMEAALALLDSVLPRIQADSPEPLELSLNLELPLLTSAAWQATQMSLASAHLPLDWASRAAEAYELQELYETRQAVVFDLMTGGDPGVSVTDGDDDPVPALRRLQGQLNSLLLLLGYLEKSYGELLSPPPDGS